MGSSLSKSHLPRNYWIEETGQVNTSYGHRAAAGLKVYGCSPYPKCHHTAPYAAAGD